MEAGGRVHGWTIIHIYFYGQIHQFTCMCMSLDGEKDLDAYRESTVEQRENNCEHAVNTLCARCGE